MLFEKGQADLARRNLQWVAENAVDDDLRSVARLRLAGVMLEAKQFDDALKQLEGAKSPAFAGLVADRRGDVHLAQGKTAEARTAYEAAFKGLDERVSYRQLVEAKLTALGVSPAASGVKP